MGTAALTPKQVAIIKAIRRDFGGTPKIDMLYGIANVEFVNRRRTWADIRLRGMIAEDGWCSFILSRDGACEPIELPYK